MPIYSYRDKQTGEIVERVVSIEDRDKQKGFERVITFTGSVWAPTSGGMR